MKRSTSVLLGWFHQVNVWIEGCEWMQKGQRAGLCLTAPSSSQPHSFLWTVFLSMYILCTPPFQTNSAAGSPIGFYHLGYCVGVKLEDSRREKAFCFFGFLAVPTEAQWDAILLTGKLLRTLVCPATSLLTEERK